MKNIRLYEEFAGGVIPKEPDLANEISEFLDITEDFKKNPENTKPLHMYS